MNRQVESETDFIEGVDYSDRDLRGWDFQDAKLDRPNFTNADCQGANFRRSSLYRARSNGANFAGVDFTEARLFDCNFVAADLRGACFRRASIRSLVLITKFPNDRDREDDAKLDGANFYQCDIPFDLLRIGVLRQQSSSYGPIGVVTPRMARRFCRAANAAANPLANIEDSNTDNFSSLEEIEASWPLLKIAFQETVAHIDRHRDLYEPNWQQKQQQVKRVVEEVGGSIEAFDGRETVLKPSCWIDHPREWLSVLALPDMETFPELRGRSLLEQALEVLCDRQRLQPYSSLEKARLILPRPRIDIVGEFCGALDRLKELYVDRWFGWLDRHPEKVTLAKTIFALCHEDEDFASQRDRAYTNEMLKRKSRV